MKLVKKLKKLFQRKNDTQTQVIYKNSTSTYSLTAECTMEISSHYKNVKNEINAYLDNLIKKYRNNTEKLIQFFKLKGISIYRIKNADKILSLFGYNQGFIIPLKGINALMLTIVLSIFAEKKFKLGFYTKEMLIFDQNAEFYTVVRALHKYYGFKNNLPGFDYQSQKMFKKVNDKKNGQTNIKALQIKDILACKEALARDLEAIDFALKISLEYEHSKNVLNKINTATSATT